MLEGIGPEFECLKGWDRNSNVRKDMDGIPMLEGIGPEFQCLNK